MDASNFDKISNNCDILICIYRRLNLDDQLRFACVSKTLKSVFDMCIARESFRTLTIRDKNPNGYVITNQSTGTNQVCLSAEDLQQLIQKHGGKVRELIVNCPDLLDWRDFGNLTNLQCNWQKMAVEDLKTIAENLEHLERLYLEYFHFGNDENLIVEILLKMTSLKGLWLGSSYQNSTIEYENFRRLVTQLKLEFFKLSSQIQPTANEISLGERALHQVEHLKELRSETWFEPHNWSQNYPSFLSNFEHLTKLVIRILDNVTGDTLHTLAQTCGNLEQLTIFNTEFRRIDVFRLPVKVKDLTLSNCHGVFLVHLKQILNESSLRKFTSRATRYHGAHYDFAISSQIETLRVDYIDFRKFKSFYADKHRLKHLTWNNAAGFRSYRHTAAGELLPTCINLETLDMMGQIAVKTLVQLKNLRKLLMPLIKMPHQWTYITDLLKHSSLEELNIHKCVDAIDMSLDETPPVRGFPTNLQSLAINTTIFEMAFDFWLDLFICNKQLRLKCMLRIQQEMDFLRKLMQHEKFPQTLRTMDVCGFNISCAEMRKNLEVATEKVYPIDSYMNRIILSWE